MSTLHSKPFRAVTGRRTSPEIPPLEPGDRLTRSEFHRRYKAMAEGVRAELVEGVVFMSSPVSLEFHGEPHADLGMWLSTYRVSAKGLRVGDNSTAFLDDDNEPQPDLLMMIPRELGGQAGVVDGYVDGTPEFVAEVSSSTVSLDMNGKLRAYRAAGVREYLVWRVRDGAVDWFERVGDEFISKREIEGLLRSIVFPGLWLDANALLAGDLQRVLEVLRQGIATPEHAAFVAKLAAKISSK